MLARSLKLLHHTTTKKHYNIYNRTRMNLSNGPAGGPPGGSRSGSGGNSNSPANISELKDLIAKMEEGISPRGLLNLIAPSFNIPPGADDMYILRILVAMIEEPPRRRELPQYNTIEDAVELIKKSRKILVLSGAGISTSAGLPDFRSRNGIYVQIHAEHPDLNDPKSMFDIEYFRENPMPFYQFAKALYPGQYKPTIGHKFIRCIEDHGKLLRNYSQNIDTLEKQAGIKRVVECHGSFARATCTNCEYNVDGDEIRDDIMSQKIPYCPRCQEKEDGPEDGLGVMKPNIVFFGEQLGDDFHKSLETDKMQADLLIVIGSSLKVKPVAYIPKCVPPEIPQILINKEPLDHMNFDIELLGNCDFVIQELCLRLGRGWTNICETQTTRLTPIAGLPRPDADHKPQPSNQPEPSSQQTKLGNNKSSKKDAKNDPVPSGSRDLEESTEDDNEDVRSFRSNQATLASDDDDDWEDIEIVSLNPKAKANVQIPDSSFIYLEPKTYLFPGAELTNAQLSDYTKTPSPSPEDEEEEED